MNHKIILIIGICILVVILGDLGSILLSTGNVKPNITIVNNSTPVNYTTASSTISTTNAQTSQNTTNPTNESTQSSSSNSQNSGYNDTDQAVQNKNNANITQ